MIFSENRYPPSDQVRGQSFSGSCSCARTYELRAPAAPAESQCGFFRTIAPADGIRAGNWRGVSLGRSQVWAAFEPKRPFPSNSKWGAEAQRTRAQGPDAACPGLDPASTDWSAKRNAGA